MPFDGTGFEVKREPPRRIRRSDNVAAILILVVALLLLVMPVSAAGLIDIVEYIRGG